MSEVELKPCPACLGAAHIESDLVSMGHGQNAKEWFVQCRECGLRTEGSVVRKDLEVENWNTRASGWISVDERLPTDGTKCLVSSSWGVTFAVLLCCIPGSKYWQHCDTGLDEGEVYMDNDLTEFKVTHWMPLPPEQES